MLHYEALKSHFLSFKASPPVALTPQLRRIVPQVQEANCVIWYFKLKCVVTVQRFCVSFGREAPMHVFIYKYLYVSG
jgi:hypothetical protein